MRCAEVPRRSQPGNRRWRRHRHPPASSNLLEKHGHSLALARKFAFILGYLDKETQSWRTAQRLFASYGAEAHNYGAMALADSIGSEFEYLDLKGGFDDYIDCAPDASTSQNLAFCKLSPDSLSRRSNFR